jgi:hypothetical protein
MKIKNLETKISDYLEKVSNAYREDALNISNAAERLTRKPVQLNLKRSKSFFDSLPSFIELQTAQLVRGAIGYEEIAKDEKFIKNLASLINDTEGIYFITPIEGDELNNFKILWKMLIEAKRELNRFKASAIDEERYFQKDRGIEKIREKAKELFTKLEVYSLIPEGPMPPKYIAFEMLSALQDLTYNFKKSIDPLVIVNDTLGLNKKRFYQVDKKKELDPLEYSKFIARTYLKNSSLLIDRIPPEFWDL